MARRRVFIAGPTEAQRARQAERAAASTAKFDAIKVAFVTQWEARVAAHNARIEARDAQRAAVQATRDAERALWDQARATARDEQQAQLERWARERHAATMERMTEQRDRWEELRQERQNYWARIKAEREAAKQARWLGRPIDWSKLKPVQPYRGEKVGLPPGAPC